MSARRLVSSGSPFEPEIGFSRSASGRAHFGRRYGASVCHGWQLGDVYGQTKRCLEIIDAAITEAGGSLQNVTRTRVMLVDMTTWREAARAHGEHFGAIRPACTFVQVSRFIYPQWLVEIEVDAIVALLHRSGSNLHGEGPRPCPLWVKHQRMSVQYPLYPRKQTLTKRIGRSALCQKQTLAAAENRKAAT